MIKPITAAALELQVREIFQPDLRSDAGPADRPLIALETFRDLQVAMQPQAFRAIIAAAFNDAATAMSNARIKPTKPSTADQLHHAAGSVASIGAHRLHLFLCDLEDAVRADLPDAVGSLLDQAAEAKRLTEDWYAAAIRKLDRTAVPHRIVH